MLGAVERRYPAAHYVLVDDKLRILDRRQAALWARARDDGLSAPGSLRARCTRAGAPSDGGPYACAHRGARKPAAGPCFLPWRRCPPAVRLRAYVLARTGSRFRSRCHADRPWLEQLRDSSEALQGVLGALLEAERHFSPPASPLERLQQITTSPEWAWLQPLYRLIADIDHALAYAQESAGRARLLRSARTRASCSPAAAVAGRAGLPRALSRAAAERSGGRHGARGGAARRCRRCRRRRPISPSGCTPVTSGTSGGGSCAWKLPDAVRPDPGGNDHDSTRHPASHLDLSPRRPSRTW